MKGGESLSKMYRGLVTRISVCVDGVAHISEGSQVDGRGSLGT